MTLREEYSRRLDSVLNQLAAELSDQIVGYLDGVKRIDRVSARAKNLDRFLNKASKKNQDDQSPKYSNPLLQIQDQIGARVVVFYKSDVEVVSKILLKYLRPTEAKDLIPSSEWEFGYFGRHFICLFPTELIRDEWPKEDIPNFFELQIKTLFQHAWSEAEHDLGYKPESGDLTSEQVRMLAFTSAQAWGADKAFDDLFAQLEEKRAANR